MTSRSRRRDRNGARDLSRRNAGTADPLRAISRPLRQPSFVRTKVRAPFARATMMLKRCGPGRSAVRRTGLRFGLGSGGPMRLNRRQPNQPHRQMKCLRPLSPRLATRSKMPNALVWCLRNSYPFAAMDFGRRLGASDEHIRQWICEERATTPPPKRHAALRVALKLAWGFVAQSVEYRWGYTPSFAPRPRPISAQRMYSYFGDTTRGAEVMRLISAKKPVLIREPPHVGSCFLRSLLAVLICSNILPL